MTYDMLKKPLVTPVLLALAVQGCVGTGIALASDGPAIEEILVTSRKRAESLQEVPLAVTAFTELAIDRKNVNRPADFIGLTSNISMVDSVNVGEGRVNIRGIQGPFDTEQPFALVIDGVLSANPNSLNQDLVDIQQIEVVKGPQGALYGRNSIGGAITITTKRPTDEVEGKLQVGYGNGSEVKAIGVISGPLAGEKIVGRLVASHKERDGHFHNDFLNTNVDHYQEQMVQGRIIATLSDTVELDLRGRASRIKAGAGYFHTQVDGAILGAMGLPQYAAYAFDTDDVSQPWRSNIDAFNQQERLDFSAKLDWETGYGTLTAIASYAKQDEYFFADAPFNPMIFDPATFFSLDPIPLFGFSRFAADGAQLTTREQEDKSFEIKFASPSENRLRWIVGAYAADINRLSGQTTVLDQGPGVVVVETLVTDPNSPSPTNTMLLGDNDNKAYAVFGQAEFDVTDRLEVAVALRWDKEKRKNTNLVPNILSPASVIQGNPTPLTQYPGLVRKTSFDDLQPKMTVRYTFAEDNSVYASYGEGFRSGGYNAAGSGDLVRAVDNPASVLTDDFGSEKSEAWEVGLKTLTLDGRLAVNAALFYTDVTNAHDFKFFPVSLTRAISILDKVRNKGVEVDATFQATEDLSMYASFGYIDAEIRDSSEDVNAIGNKVPETPEYQFALGVEYVVPIADTMDLVFNADYQRVGETWFDSLNTPGTQRSPYDLVNGRIAVEGETWTVALWGNNIFDEKYPAGTTVVSFLNYPYRAPPRTYGVDLTYRF